MCGITLFISKNKNNIINDIIKSLYLIQNRGYDSMGLCYYDNINQHYNIIKHASSEENDCFNILQKIITQNFINSHIALGHTRWATHGGKTDINAHPHMSQNENIILVHNGIINNFNIIKDDLIKENFVFQSETDSEVIANLIEYYLINNNNNIEDAIKLTTQKLEGTWALIIIYTKQPNSIFITRKGSPLLIGSNNNYIICCSEITGFAGLIYDYIVLDNDDIIKINNNTIESISNNINNYQVKKIESNNIPYLDTKYKHWMIKEITEQPETIQKAYNYGARVINNNIKLGGLEKLKTLNNKIKHVILIGCGTSFNAALLANIYFNSNNNFISVLTINACEFNENCLPKSMHYASTLCVFLTQSGETIDVYNALRICKYKGCITMGVVNKVDSLIARNVNCGVYLNAGHEISVASTKSFTSMIVVLSLIQMFFNQYYCNISKNIEIINQLRLLSFSIEQQLKYNEFNEKIELLVNNIVNNNINSIFILGKKKLYPIALEASLKIKEVCYIHAEGFSAGSLKHGPFALLDNNNLTLLLIDNNDTKNLHILKSTYYEIKSRTNNLYIISNSSSIMQELNINNDKFILINRLNYYNEIIFIVALQYLAYNISIKKNINPDKPRNLAKVVSVE